MRFRTILALPLIALAACSMAPDKPAAGPAPEISLETLKSVTEMLSSDAFEGRAPTTAGEEKTVKLIADRFQQAGLKPGNGESWFQDVPLVELTSKNISPLTFSGGQQPLSFNYRNDMVINTYRITPSTAIKDSEVVFVGYGINAPERGWNDYAGLDVKGKTVVILVNDPDYQTKELKGPFGGRAMTYYGRWTYKYEEAARQGAAAAIIVHEEEPAAYPWGVVQSSWTGPQIVQDAKNNHMDQSQAIGWVQLEAAKKIFASAGQDFGALSAAAKQKGFKPVPLGLKASVSFETDIRKQMSKNVVGVLPGKSRPNEYVLYMAHWDHLGRCDAIDGDDICNGAVDNATGTAGLIALAEAQAKRGPAERSIVFLAVTAEESGLLGSKFYAENPVFPLAQTVGGINMDGLAITGAAKDVVVVGGGKSELEDGLKRAVLEAGRVIVAEPTPEKGFYYRSDHFSMAKLGVPMLYARSGMDMADGGPERGRQLFEDYTSNRYHKPSDEYDPNWNWDGAIADLKLYFAVGRELADGDTWPNWVKGDEFRAARDKSRSPR